MGKEKQIQTVFEKMCLKELKDVRAPKEEKTGARTF